MRHDYVGTSVDDHWLDLYDAAELTGASFRRIVEAITGRQLRATTTHSLRPGDWLVRRSDLLRWAFPPPHRPRLRIVR